MFCTFDLPPSLQHSEVTVGAFQQLGLFVGDLYEQPPAPPSTPTPAADWTLRHFLRDWFAPNHIDSRELGSVEDYSQAVVWWEAMGANPPLRDVTQTVATTAAMALRKAISPKTGKPLAPAYQAKIVRHWRVLFAHAGPRFGRRGAYANLIAEAPWFDLPLCRKPAKGTWEYSEARAIAAACELMHRPAVDCGAAAWWKLAIGTLYYFGIRDGQLLDLRLGALDDTGGIWRLIVAEVEKTGKRLVRRCPEDWLAAVRAVHGTDWRDVDALLLPWPPASRGKPRQLAISSRQSQILRMHGSESSTARAKRLIRPQRTLQDHAGLPIERHWELHAWRRLHVKLRSQSGAADAIAAGSAAAQHSDSAVTRDHYYDAEEMTPLVIAARFPLW